MARPTRKFHELYGFFFRARPCTSGCRKLHSLGSSKIGGMRIPLFHVDAFANQRFRGNPAAVCFLDSWLDEGLLRRVAAENHVSATAFLVTGTDGYELRWFTPLCEIKLCGHATLAAAHLLLNDRQPPRDWVTFKTRFRGMVTVRKAEDCLAMDFPAMPPTNCKTVPATLASALGLKSQPVE